MRWAKRRHPEKSGYWIAKRYFSECCGSTWSFKDKTTGKRLIRLTNDIRTYRHIKIKADANPFDPEWNGYFRNREKLLKMKAVSLYIGKVLKQQSGKCPYCQQLIRDEDLHHLHYLDGDKTHRRIGNVLMLHKSCRKGFKYIERKHVSDTSIDMGVNHA